jgi:hypothetical protein
MLLKLRQPTFISIPPKVIYPLARLTHYSDHLIADNPASQDPRIVGRAVSEYSGSQQCLSLVTDWLGECCASHRNCGTIDESSLPPRVIDLGPVDGPLSPYLLVSEGNHGFYATLSHRWGPKEFPPLVTTTENFREHKEGIPLLELPASFRDAMILTRSLGLQYLWIDSLCIIQDSPSDWAAQSVLMASIYGQGHINISAAAASNSHEGIFQSRTIPQQSCRIPYQSKYMTTKGEIFMRAPLTSYLPGNEFNHIFNSSENVYTDPLFTRAWVLQERMLSPRNIHFGAGELLWECQTLTAYESRTKSTPEGPDADLKRMLAPKESNRETSSGWFTRNIHARWLEVVGAYSRLDLSYETDKFPAISGLAHEFQRQTGDEYLAGLWKSDLHRSLLWRPAGVDNLSIPSNLLRRQPKQWRAPSWSWASWDGYINGSLAIWHQRVKYKHDIFILEAGIVPAEDDVMGRLKGGHIRVRGLWNQVRLGRKGLAAFRIVLEGDAPNFPGQFALLDEPDETNRGSRYAPVSELTGSIFDCVQIGIWNDHQPSDEFYQKSDDTLWGLLLQPSEDRIDCYCRVGVAYIRLEQDNDKLKISEGWKEKELTII